MGRSKKPNTVTLPYDDPSFRKGRLRDLGGVAADDWNELIGNQAVGSLWLHGVKDDALTRQVRAVTNALAEIAPRDALEGMLGAQIVAAHNAAMECYRRAMLPSQTFEGRKDNLTQAGRLSRTLAQLLDTLNKHRGKGQQKVTVEHVHVHDGGQAIVGAVSHPGGGAGPEPAEQPYAQATSAETADDPSDAAKPALRREDSQGISLPEPGDEERPMQNARRQEPRRPKE